jgi:hypothetical protein
MEVEVLALIALDAIWLFRKELFFVYEISDQTALAGESGSGLLLS